tara:strand:+ start:1298 stop:1609 length:312 start_codon:yes stop_codon:yes gene_type:complete
MGKRGRPKGGTNKSCLIKDPLLHPFEVHVDGGNKQYILYDIRNKNNVGYYTGLANVLRAIMETKYVPTGGDNNVYTLREYIKAMGKMRNEIATLLQRTYRTTL